MELRRSFYVKRHNGLYPRTVGKGIYYFLSQLSEIHPATSLYLFYELKRIVASTQPHLKWVGWELLLLAKYGDGLESKLGQECECHRRCFTYPIGCCAKSRCAFMAKCESAGIPQLMEQMANHFTRVTTTLKSQRRLADIMAFPASEGQTQLTKLQAIAVSLASLVSERRMTAWQMAQEISRSRYLTGAYWFQCTVWLL
jgi:hypothetical protein